MFVYAWDRWLPFITAGAAFGDIKTTPPAPDTYTSTVKVGWTAGLGVEYAFSLTASIQRPNPENPRNQLVGIGIPLFSSAIGWIRRNGSPTLIWTSATRLCFEKFLLLRVLIYFFNY
jgi:hypothetical protein